MAENAHITIVPSAETEDAYSSFVANLLEPVAGGVPIDTAYNSMVRHARDTAWRRANILTEYRDAQVKIAWAQSRYDREFMGKDDFSSHAVLVESWRQAVADQIRTPCSRGYEIEWKRRAAKKPYLPITAAEIAAAIAADQAFLSAHPVRVTKRGRHNASS